MSEELLPCPFCGGVGETCRGPVSFRWGTRCTNCDVWLDERAETEEQAIATWNRRQPAAPVQVSEAMVGLALEAYRDAYYRDDLEHEPAMKRAIEAALQAGVPSGWPTDAMIVAGDEAIIKALNEIPSKAEPTPAELCFKAMLAAAPAPGEGR